MKIDMGRKGPLGPDVRIKNGVLYIEGTNHWLEWVHHFIPGARRREIKWGEQVASLAVRENVRIIAGHSVGGTIAMIAAHITNAKCYTYGAKRPPRGYYASGKHYRIKADIVPFLPPWRPTFPTITLDYGTMGPIKAHGPRSYYEQMGKDGVR